MDWTTFLVLGQISEYGLLAAALILTMSNDSLKDRTFFFDNYEPLDEFENLNEAASPAMSGTADHEEASRLAEEILLAAPGTSPLVERYVI